MILLAIHGLIDYMETTILQFDGFRHHLCIDARVQATDIGKQAEGMFSNST
jgi:hypothetical protein